MKLQFKATTYLTVFIQIPGNLRSRLQKGMRTSFPFPQELDTKLFPPQNVVNFSYLEYISQY